MSNAPSTPSTPDAATLRRLAVLADADPRTVLRRIRGLPVRGMAARRVDKVIARQGIPLAIADVPNPS